MRVASLVCSNMAPRCPVSVLSWWTLQIPLVSGLVSGSTLGGTSHLRQITRSRCVKLSRTSSKRYRPHPASGTLCLSRHRSWPVLLSFKAGTATDAKRTNPIRPRVRVSPSQSCIGIVGHSQAILRSVVIRLACPVCLSWMQLLWTLIPRLYCRTTLLDRFCS